MSPPVNKNILIWWSHKLIVVTSPFSSNCKNYSRNFTLSNGPWKLETYKRNLLTPHLKVTGTMLRMCALTGWVSHVTYTGSFRPLLGLWWSMFWCQGKSLLSPCETEGLASSFEWSIKLVAVLVAAAPQSRCNLSYGIDVRFGHLTAGQIDCQNNHESCREDMSSSTSRNLLKRSENSETEVRLPEVVVCPLRF